MLRSVDTLFNMSHIIIWKIHIRLCGITEVKRSEPTDNVETMIYIAIVTCRAMSGGKNASGVKGFGRAEFVMLLISNLMIVIGGLQALRFDHSCLRIIYDSSTRAHVVVIKMSLTLIARTIPMMRW